MAFKTTTQIQQFFESNQHRMDSPQQWYGTEPNSYQRDWDSSTFRMLMFACWPYEQAAGNQAMPLVYRTVNEASEHYLADRCYYPATPRDFSMMEKAGVPLHGIESKHQMADFDVIGTSISYPVLTINFVKQLMASDIPPTWAPRRTFTDRGPQIACAGRMASPEDYPFVMVGGQAYGAPEALAPIADAVFCGEAEDEPGNPGLAAVCRRIERMKEIGWWSTDRIKCYERLAIEFDFLYFPMFFDVDYRYEDRPGVERAAESRHAYRASVADYHDRQIDDLDFAVKPSRQVVAITSKLSSMAMPRPKRFVSDLDAIDGLTNPPLLYVDPGMGSGDLEVARGCPAWCSFCRLCLGGETEVLVRDGVRRLDTLVGQVHEVWTSGGWVKADFDQHGEDTLDTITFAPAFQGWSHFAQRKVWKKNSGDFRVTHRATASHRWPLASGGETHHLAEGDFIAAEFTRGTNDEDYRAGWLHGLVFGDGTRSNGREHNSYRVLINKAQEHLLDNVLAWGERVNKVEDVSAVLWRVNLWSETDYKAFPQDQSSDYVRGFIEGWDAADGYESMRTDTRRRISSQHPDAYSWLRANAAFGGWVLTGFYESKNLETNYGTRKNPLCQYGLTRLVGWKVVRIEEGDEPEPVYCATVPGVGYWTLATGVYTGNTYAQKPYRQKSVDKSIEEAKALTVNTGGTHIAPFSPDFPMHSCDLETTFVTTSFGILRLSELVRDAPLVPSTQMHGRELEGSVQVRQGDAAVTGVYRTRKSTVIETSLSNGLRLRTTPDHLVERVTLTGGSGGLRKRLDGSSAEWATTESLQAGDWLRVRYGSDLWPTERVSLTDLPSGGVELTPDLAWLLGLLSGDGSVRDGLHIRVNDPDIQNRVAEVFSESLGMESKVRLESSESHSTEVGRWSRVLAHWLEDNFGICDKETRRQVPEVIRRSPHDVVAAYVSGVLDADGCVVQRSTHRRLVEVVHATSYREFSLEMAELAHALGHAVSCSSTSSGTYNLSIKSGVGSDWAWLRMAGARRLTLEAQLQRGVECVKVFPSTGADGVYYTKVVDQTDGGQVWVGDLEVPDTQCFNTAGITVHNTEKKNLIGRLLSEVTDDIDASSMRVDDFIADPSYILLQAHGGMHTVTLGVEGNSQRMRDAVGKGCSDEDVKEAVARAIQAGIRKIKLYMIASVPGETREDIQSIVDLTKDLVAIRDSMGAKVQLILSWTPMLIEGNTPLQWFSPTYSTLGLGEVWEQLHELNVTVKMGSKVQFDRMTYFQLCQRASREVGQVLVESVADAGTGSWGGVPKQFSQTLDDNLMAAGFDNGLADVYDERFKHDLFGWEMVDQGINTDLLWRSYQQMSEFLQHTDGVDYDSTYDEHYHGNEWTERCDTRCQGKSCGACTPVDLKIRRNYIQGAANDREVDLSKVDVIDFKSEVTRVRVRAIKAIDRRLVMNDHWRYAIRRAAVRAGVPLARRSIAFASDVYRSKDWTSGVDYIDFSTTTLVTPDQVTDWVKAMDSDLGRDIDLTGFAVLPGSSPKLGSVVDTSLFSLQVDKLRVEMKALISKFFAQDYVPMVIKDDSRYMGKGRSEVNARDLVDDMWLVNDGHRLILRMLVRGAANPYTVYASMTATGSWLAAAKFPAIREEVFVAMDDTVNDLFRPVCACGMTIPATVLDVTADACPRCSDLS